MFFNNFFIIIFLKFFWLGLFLGLFKIFCNMICKVSNTNIFVVNIVNFSFWSLFSLFFIYFCSIFYNLEFCWFGFIGCLLGINFIKISVEFFFTNLIKLLYNKINNKKARKITNGKLGSNEKV